MFPTKLLIFTNKNKSKLLKNNLPKRKKENRVVNKEKERKIK